VNSLSYSGVEGAAGLPTDLKLSRLSDSAVLFEQAPTFDVVGNVTKLNTTLPAGTDNQAFCYDEQNRLIWASSVSDLTPCGGTTTVGTLSGASYTQSFNYDTLGRLTSGPLVSYNVGGRRPPQINITDLCMRD
jgi:hypothetical protein